MSNARSVIVCGGGIVGLSTAYYLAGDGFDVTVVERNAEGSRYARTVTSSEHYLIAAFHIKKLCG